MLEKSPSVKNVLQSTAWCKWKYKWHKNITLEIAKTDLKSSKFIKEYLSGRLDKNTDEKLKKLIYIATNCACCYIVSNYQVPIRMWAVVVTIMI